MDKETIINVEKMFHQSVGWLYNNHYIKDNDIKVLVVGGYCLFKDPLYRDLMSQYKILKTDDVDIKLIVNRNTQNPQNTNHVMHNISIYFNVAIELLQYLKSEDIQFKTIRSEVSDTVMSIATDMLDLNVFDEDKLAIYRCYLIINPDFRLSIDPVTGCNSELSIFNIIYLMIFTMRSIELEQLSNRIPKAGRVFARFIMVYMVNYSHHFDKGILELLETIQDELYNAKGYRDKLRHLVNNYEFINMYIDQIYVPNENDNAEVPTILNMVKSLLGEYCTDANIFAIVQFIDDQLIPQQHGGKLQIEKIPQSEKIEHLASINALKSNALKSNTLKSNTLKPASINTNNTNSSIIDRLSKLYVNCQCSGMSEDSIFELLMIACYLKLI